MDWELNLSEKRSHNAEMLGFRERPTVSIVLERSLLLKLGMLIISSFAFTFTFKSFSRRSYPERLTNWCIHLMTSSGTATLQ